MLSGVVDCWGGSRPQVVGRRQPGRNDPEAEHRGAERLRAPGLQTLVDDLRRGKRNSEQWQSHSIRVTSKEFLPCDFVAIVRKIGQSCGRFIRSSVHEPDQDTQIATPG